MSELVCVTFKNTGETKLISYPEQGDFVVTLNGQETVEELSRAEALRDGGALVDPPSEHGSEVLTLEDVQGE